MRAFAAKRLCGFVTSIFDLLTAETGLITRYVIYPSIGFQKQNLRFTGAGFTLLGALSDKCGAPNPYFFLHV